MSAAHVIVSGEYSDFSVHALVTGTVEQAEALVARMNEGRTYDPYRVMALPVIAHDAEPYPTLRLDVWITADGEVVNEFTEEVDEWPIGERGPGHRWFWFPAQGRDAGTLRVFGHDIERVRKVYSDLRARIIADPTMRAERQTGQGS